ncbi:MAG: Rieske (2Fe-2S) protein [Anaerolineales bacterium]|uniref:Rieske (2Fe-2S) protein n=1 Tax=Candidatus Desulfolinea nitratireducens TaxID=2841698 RepID=A0A8J6TH72_9CHLR|nr:Rieske (2Fe-2S) protein [Candidatus Desulfolinea nitratireducens]MBL6959678.1 Rieske (2Fe-2S) protein [Anaerolineales bacterium]
MKTIPDPTPKPSVFTSRRQFIQLGLATVSAAWLGTWLQVRLFPQTNTIQEAKPVSFPLSELPVGGTKTITYGGVSVVVLRTRESLRAFSLVCTHLGCLVAWEKDKKEFYCPCHDGRFDEFGDVLAGPPPIPLEQFPISVEGEMVTVGEI